VAADGAAAGSHRSEVASKNRESILDAIERLVHLQQFVAASSQQVGELYQVSNRLIGFIGTIREIADLTNLISLNAAIEAPGRPPGAGRGGPRKCGIAAQSGQASKAGGLVAANWVSRRFEEMEEPKPSAGSASATRPGPSKGS
jgi:hypothetical protein